MERIKKGATAKDEEVFQFLDELRRKSVKDPSKAIAAMCQEFGIEQRIAVIYMRRYTSCFGDVQ